MKFKNKYNSMNNKINAINNNYKIKRICFKKLLTLFNNKS